MCGLYRDPGPKGPCRTGNFSNFIGGGKFCFFGGGGAIMILRLIIEQ